MNGTTPLNLDVKLVALAVMPVSKRPLLLYETRNSLGQGEFVELVSKM